MTKDIGQNKKGGKYHGKRKTGRYLPERPKQGKRIPDCCIDSINSLDTNISIHDTCIRFVRVHLIQDISIVIFGK